jgi:hypothetical protein
MQTRITPTGTPVTAAFAQAPDIVRAELARAMFEATALLEREVKDATPTATGLTRGSISSFVTEIPNGVLGVVGSAQPHIVYVELGTMPHFPPLAPIQDWVRAKFGYSDEAQIEGAALAIARKIAARGTLGVGMFHRTFARLTPRVETIFVLARDRIAARLAGNS